MRSNRLMNKHIPASDLEIVGNAYHNLIRSSAALMAWSNNNIHKTASAFEPVGGIRPPYILNQMLVTESEFFPNQKERQTVAMGSMFVYEEPFETLETDDITIVSVIEEFKKTVVSDPFLKSYQSNLRRVERLHRFQLASYGGKKKKDSVTLYIAFRVEYIIDSNVKTRQRM